MVSTLAPEFITVPSNPPGLTFHELSNTFTHQNDDLSAPGRKASLSATATPFIPHWQHTSVFKEPPRYVASPEPYNSRRPSFSKSNEMALSAWMAQQTRVQEHLAVSVDERANVVEWDFGGYDLEIPSSPSESHIMIDVPLIHPPGINYSIAPTAELSNILYYDSNGFGFPSPLSTPIIVTRFVDSNDPPRAYCPRFASIDYGSILSSDSYGSPLYPEPTCLTARRSSIAFEGCNDPEVDHLADLNKITDVRHLSGSLREASNKRGVPTGTLTPPTTNQSFSSPTSPVSALETPLLTPQLEDVSLPLTSSTLPASCQQSPPQERLAMTHFWAPPGLVHPQE